MKTKEQLIAIRNSGVYHKGYEFRINSNKTEGYIRPILDEPLPLSLKDVAEIIHNTGIRYGLKKPEQLKKELLKNPNPREPWTIARGDLPKPGKQATIVHHFNTDPLKIGTLKKTGFMDYKDRGRIPQVAEGTVLAEKIPGKEGQPGTNIFGQPAPPPRIKDVKLRCGRGITLSEDGLRAIAKADGRPVLASNGMVHLFEDLKIKGDIGIRTGHVNYDGRIEVEGAVNEGYRVKGGSLCTQEIHMAEADIVGDVVVLGGINGAQLKVGGNLKAHYIHQSNIEVKGDVIVKRDLSNSTITSCGTVIVDNGKILTSTISAKHGIKAVDIGSKLSHTCDLTVGFDQKTQDMMKETKAEIEKQMAIQKKWDQKIRNLTKEVNKLDQALGSAATVRASAQKKIDTLVERLNTSPPTSNRKRHELNTQITSLKETLNRSRATITKLKEDRMAGIGKIERHSDEMFAIKESLSKLKDKYRQMDEHSLIKEGEFARTPVVQALGTLHSGTKIQGPHASVETPMDYQQIKIMESRSNKKKEAARWRMVVKHRR